MSSALVGLWAGLAATACMTGWEILFFRRYGLEACLDWEVNQHLITKVNGKAPEANMPEGLAMHFIVGIVVGIGFALITRKYSAAAVMSIAVILGLLLWALLLPMRRLVAGQGLRDDRLGWLPALVSLVGHVIYGVVLWAVLINLRAQ